MDHYLPLVILFGVGVLLSGTFIFLAYFFGPRQPRADKLDPYECGVPLTSDARSRFSVKFFLVAMIFLLFDVEAVFLFPWAVLLKKFKEAGLGWEIFAPMLVFVAMLGAGFFYEWRRGALDWEK